MSPGKDGDINLHKQEHQIAHSSISPEIGRGGQLYCRGAQVLGVPRVATETLGQTEAKPTLGGPVTGKAVRRQSGQEQISDRLKGR